eukprot:CAMPEP_0114442834 /NCGR_PEP_ID=MMETSP0103-20121206/17175_1 /TAXON_ID=37642 ORGANISM="Paraphysomonas imperforata, Strain PA2" /NCGR_SAMPLE_ID=MMETSP0103 /ASSEMBLY_ACC=CAM_ASM_000201 /LENGTH=210 /DNA_ID=CAMNT_0001614153 /DNA_START=99 /DNA_END=731 /DNA_ORIENTATION=-
MEQPPQVSYGKCGWIVSSTSTNLGVIEESASLRTEQVSYKAVLVYRWTVHYEWATKQAVMGFRVQHKPRRVCPKCQFPMTFDGELIDHRVCFNNGSYMAWMSKDLDSCRKALYNLCCNPKTFKVPEMKRDLTGDKVKLSDADLAATKAKHENFRTAQSQSFADDDMEMMQAKKDEDGDGKEEGEGAASKKMKRMKSKDGGQAKVKKGKKK